MNRSRRTLPWRSTIRSLWLTLAASLGASLPAHADRIDDFVAAQMKKQNIPGISIAVLKDGKPVKFKGYGVANLESGVPVTPDTVFEIGSVSKQFIAGAILLLERDGRVSLQDAIGKYIPEVPASWQAITIRHLLTHTSGLMRDAPGMQLTAQPDIDAIRAGYSAQPAFKPGEKLEYSNLGYFTLAEIITRATGRPWPHYVQDRIFGPLGMKSTRTTTYEELVAQRASGYLLVDGKFQNAQRIVGVRPSGAFLSTVRDLAKWDAALYSDVLFTAAQREMMWSAVKLNDGSTRNYGLGWEITKVGSHRLVRHAGTMIGFRAELSRYLDDGLTVVVLSNGGQALVEKVAGGIAARYIDGLQPQRKAMKLPDAALDAYTGKYQLANGVLSVTRRGGQLALAMEVAQRTMEMAVLTPESATSFFDEDTPRPTYSFETAQGTLQFVARSEEGREIMRGARLAPAQ